MIITAFPIKMQNSIMMPNDAVQMLCPQAEYKLLDQKVFQSLQGSYSSAFLYGFICSKAASLKG